MKTLLQFIVVFLTISLLVLSVQSHICNHDTDESLKEFYSKFSDYFDELSQKQRILNDNENRLLAVPPSPIRITTDMSALNSGTITTIEKTYLTSIIKAVQSFLAKFLKVIPTVGNNRYQNGNMCLNDVTVPSSDSTTGIANSDLHLYFIYSNDPAQTYLVNAGWCDMYRASPIVRPSFGRVNFNLLTMKITGKSNKQYESDVKVTIHELIHVLGFSYDSIRYWIDKTTNLVYPSATVSMNIRSFTTTILKTPNVLQTVQKYYNCATLQGMQLENQGGTSFQGSHWESSILQSELMSASTTKESSNLSVFTTALLKDTGFWDEVNENMSTPIYWGKNKGCNFVNQACQYSPTFEEFSSVGQKGCSFQGNGQGVASTENYSDNCFYIKSYSNKMCTDVNNSLDPLNQFRNAFMEDFDQSSKCFVSNLINPLYQTTSTSSTRCHQYKCSPDSSQITITSSSLLGFSVICKLGEEGVSKDALYNSIKIGSITCPSSFKKICDDKTCKNYCSQNGFCLQGQCFCNPGYSSEDCSLACPVYSQNGVCVTVCSAGKYANPDNTCKQTCPSQGFYVNGGICSPCNFSCSSCTGAASNQCKSCQFLTYLSAGMCKAICPAGTFPDEPTKACITCPPGCVTCTNQFNCGTCVATSYVKTGNLCINSPCDPSCLTCNLSINTQCTSCSAGRFLNSANKTCVFNTSCPIATFADTLFNICRTCSLGCSSCTSLTVCIKCDTTNGYRLIGNACSLCVAPCTTCLTSSTSSCTSCDSGMYLQGNVCHQNCPSTFYNGENFQCTQCIAGCLKCTAGTFCLSCDTANGYIMLNKNGVNICISATSCFSPCLTCPSFNPSICYSCGTGFNLQGTVCQPACNLGFYSDYNFICTPCSSSCLGCTGTETTCTSCSPTTVNLIWSFIIHILFFKKSLSKGQCVPNCLTGQILVENVCTSATVAVKSSQIIIGQSVLLVLLLQLILLL